MGEDRSYFRYPDEKLLMSGNIFSNGEFSIIELIEKGLSSKEIAQKLFRSILTITTHRSNIIKKSGLSSITEVIHDLKENGKPHIFHRPVPENFLNMVFLFYRDKKAFDPTGNMSEFLAGFSYCWRINQGKKLGRVFQNQVKEQGLVGFEGFDLFRQQTFQAVFPSLFNSEDGPFTLPGIAQ